MNQRIRNWAIGLCILFATAASANAITIGFTPSSQSVAAGSPVSVGLDISGLGSGSAPSLGVFDVDVSFDPSLLSFSSVSFGDPTLGDQLDLFGLGGITSYDNSAAGLLNLFELSLDLSSDLNTLQADSFTLATLTFDAIGAGTSPLGISVNALGDADGEPLFATVSPGSVSITSVPEPSTVLLLGAGFIALAAVRSGRARDWSHR